MLGPLTGQRAVEALQRADVAAIPWFRSAAADLLAQTDDPERVLAIALAQITGFSSMRVRGSRAIGPF